jgi:hypothetical protein
MKKGENVAPTPREVDFLRAAYGSLKKDAAAGITG